MDGGSDTDTVSTCLACKASHPVGHCPLKLAGVEHCGLCGIAHLGYSRNCPHLNSEAQVAMMLGSLKQSTEQRALVDEATKYLRGIRGDLVRRKKVQAMKNAGLDPTRPSAGAGPSAGASSSTPSARGLPPYPQQLPSRNLPPSIPPKKYRSPYPSASNPLAQTPYESPNSGAPSSAGYRYHAQSERGRR